MSIILPPLFISFPFFTRCNVSWFLLNATLISCQCSIYFEKGIDFIFVTNCHVFPWFFMELSCHVLATIPSPEITLLCDFVLTQESLSRLVLFRLIHSIESRLCFVATIQESRYSNDQKSNFSIFFNPGIRATKNPLSRFFSIQVIKATKSPLSWFFSIQVSMHEHA